MFSGKNILLVEDDGRELKNAAQLIHDLGAKYVLAQNVDDACRFLREESFDYLLTDLHIVTKAGSERPDGLDIIEAAVNSQPDILIVATSNDPRSDIWSAAVKAGAQHFVRKPILRADELVIAFGLARERKSLVASKERKNVTLTGRWSRFADIYPHGIVVDKEVTRRSMGLAKHPRLSCILTGETGTGKEEVARLVQRFRNQAGGEVPFVAVNCSTINGNLAETLLFGHRRGAFTGAVQTTNGYVAEADGGILFLDEIHTLDIAIQQKLLRVLADGSYNRVGETKTQTSRFQLIAATTKNLEEEVDNGRFLLDLLSRITGVEIDLKPLRERLDDIPALVSLFLTRNGVVISDDLFDGLCRKLAQFYWRGNIRQLFKVLDGWIVQAQFDESELSLSNIPVFKGMRAPAEETKFPPILQDHIHSFNSLLASLQNDCDLIALVEAFEKMAIEIVMARHASIADCCKALNLARSTLDGKRRKYGLL